MLVSVRAGKDIPGRGTTSTWVKARGWNAQGKSAVTNPCDGVKSLLDLEKREWEQFEMVLGVIRRSCHRAASCSLMKPPRFQRAASWLWALHGPCTSSGSCLVGCSAGNP